MALINRLPAHDAAAAATRALEQLIGHDVILATGESVVAAPAEELLPPGATRSVVLPFGNGIVGEVTLVATSQFATAMEAAAPDASLATAALPVLIAAADAIEPVIHLQAEPDYVGEIATDTLLTSVVGDFAIVPILENDEVVAAVVVRIVDDAPALPAQPAPAEPIAAAVTTPPAPTAMPPVGAAAPLSAGPGQPGMVASYEFQPVNDRNVGLGQPRPLPLLNDVQMEVIAELGRMRMKVRDLVALEPGSVVQLDRTAGSPVDVLVNGSLLAHGEVVVIDEEFGIRVSEIIVGER